MYATECEDNEPYVPYPDSDSSDKYWVCFNKSGEPRSYACPPYLRFDEMTRSCTVYLSPNPIGKCTREGEKFKDPEDSECEKYFECNYELLPIYLSCNLNENFNPLFQQCVPKTEYNCNIPDCFDPKFQDRKWVVKESCESYYECIGDVPIQVKCPGKMYFNPHVQACMHNTNDVCKVPNSKPDLLVNIDTMCKGNVGKFLTDPYYCKGYYYCVDETTPYWSTYDNDLYFTNGICTKTRPQSCTCEDEDWANNGKTSVEVPHPDKTKFYVCTKGNLPQEKSCPSGTIFDGKQKVCVF
ncbi:unnamed protein product [Hermetia illucens]|uniref:Chitin-binding type-2 domain-containing protein n=2 Tax=Hermetia illucens TaxID=343691 RepID=A0A7R8UHA4_HERIL|nr:unnamed protein product [Hermetia illucens]